MIRKRNGIVGIDAAGLPPDDRRALTATVTLSTGEFTVSAGSGDAVIAVLDHPAAEYFGQNPGLPGHTPFGRGLDPSAQIEPLRANLVSRDKVAIKAGTERFLFSAQDMANAPAHRVVDDVDEPTKIASVVLRASTRFDLLAGLIPRRMLPARVNTEVVGDALERIAEAEARGVSRWYLRGLFALTLLVVLAECVRYLVRSIKGEKALR